jgi:hypothetical protein
MAAQFVETLDIMQSMKNFIGNLTLKTGEIAFNEVRYYAQADLQKALDDLLIYDDRVCLIIPSGDNHKNQRIGGVLRTWRESEFVLLLSDRVYGDFDAEALQGTQTNPGTVALKDLLIQGLTASQLDNPRLCFEPGNGEPFHISNAEKAEMPGRDCWSQTFRTPAGYQEAPIATVISQRHGQ